MQYLYDKLTSTYNWFAQYYYPKQEQSSNYQKHSQNYQKLSKQQKIITLRKILKQKYSFTQQLNGKIQMQFTKLIENYQHSTFSTIKPIQYPTHNKQSTNKQSAKTITFTSKILLQSDKIKCPLTINCLLQQTFPNTQPKIYINYPLFPTKSQTGQIINITSIPNPQFVQIVSKINNTQNYKYKARTGGIQVIFSKRQNKMTLKQIVDQTVQMMKRQFPFLKSKRTNSSLLKEQNNSDEQTHRIYQLSKKLKTCLLKANQIQKSQQTTKQTQQTKQTKQIKQIQQIQQTIKQNNTFKQQITKPVSILRRSQQLDILLRSINSEIDKQKQDNNKILSFYKIMQDQCDRIQKNNNFQQYYPVIDQSYKHSKQLYELLVDYQASKDCLIQIQSTIKNPTKQSNKLLSNQQLISFLNTSQLYHQNIFWHRISINRIVQQHKSNIIQQQKIKPIKN